MIKLALLDDFQNVALGHAAWRRLDGQAGITVFTDHEPDMERLVARLAPFDAIVTMRERTPFPRELIMRLDRLRLLVTTGGFNRAFDLDAAEERGIYVCGTRSLWDSTAELSWALMLALARHIPRQDADVRAGRWQTTIGHDVRGKRLGLVGLGKIAIQVAAVGKAFGMDVVAWSPNLTQQRCDPHGVTCVTREELFATSDYISLHMVLSDSTWKFIGEPDFRRMKPTAFFVNTSRGQLIDQDALVAVLAERAIGGAGLDVFDPEPLPVGHPLMAMDNVVLTPHVGYVTADQYDTYFEQIVDNVEGFLKGEKRRPLNRPPT